MDPINQPSQPSSQPQQPFQPAQPQPNFNGGNGERKSKLGLVVTLLLLLVLIAAGYFIYMSKMTLPVDTSDEAAATATAPRQQGAVQPKASQVDDLSAELDSSVSADNSSDLNAIGSEFK